MRKLRQKIAGILAAVMTLVSGGMVAYAAEDVVTDYGTIPAEWADKAFVAFTGGEAFAASDKMYDPNGIMTLAKNHMEKNKIKDVQILLRKEYGNVENYMNLSQINGKVLLDLGGHSIFVYYNIFNAQSKSYYGIFDTDIMVKNGKIKFNFNNSVISYQTYGSGDGNTKRWGFHFEDVDFSFESSKGASIASYSTSDQKTIPSIYDITFTDCNFDMTNAPAGFTLFKANHEANPDITVNYTVKGGSIKAPSMDGFKIVDLGSSNASFKYEATAEAPYYTTIVLPDTAAAPTEKVTIDGAEYSWYAYQSADGYVTYALGAPIPTDYGAIPAEWADKAFVAFTGGEAFAASDKMYDPNGIMTLAKNYMETNKVSDVQILLRKEYGNVENYLNLSQINGKVLLDLGGHSIFVYYNIFNAQSKSYYGIFDTDITVKNGKIKFNFNNSVISYQTYGAGDGNTKRWGFHFEDVDFSFESSKGASIASYSTSDQKTIPSIYDITFTDCNFDMTNAPAGFTLFKANHEANPDIRVNYTVKGGSIKAPSMDGFKIVDLGSSNASFKYEATAEAPYYTTIVLPDTAAAPTEKVTIDGTEYSWYAYQSADGLVTYALGASIPTEYGAIPAEWADKTFVAFSDGKAFAASNYMYKNADSIMNLAKAHMEGNSVNPDGTIADGSTEVQILMRKDFEKVDNYLNLAQVKGKILLDLGGHSFSVYYNMFNAQSKSYYGIFDTDITIKNGAIKYGFKNYIISYETYGTGDGNPKRWGFHFENVDFSFKGASTSIVNYKTSDQKTIPSIYDITFTDCNFDMTDAPAGFTLFKANHEENPDIRVDYTVKGGSIKAPSMDGFKIVDLGSSNASFKYEATAEAPYYTTIVLPEDAQEPTETVTIDGKEYSRYAYSSADGYVTYALGASVPTEFGVVSYDGKLAEIAVKTAGTYVVVFAKYDGDKLSEVDIVTKTFDAGITEVEQEVDFAADEIMLWQDIESIVPLCVSLSV